ncbi:MAG: type II toxin-antitoxin system VapC family toxin [Bacteroidaceae bacterium]|nr:type II toxin-antitoxin system VapC family toxin [Bacteroidaceae bacterium]
MNKGFLLDTNICIFLLKNKYKVREKIVEVGTDRCFVSEISLAELYYGASKSDRKTERLKDVEFIENIFQILPVYPVLHLYGDNKIFLEREGKRIDDFDLLIGTTAVANKLVMVTDNVSHLERIPNIQIENWIIRNT